MTGRAPVRDPAVPATTEVAAGPRRSAGAAVAVLVAALALVALLAAVHLTQGTADVGVGDLLRRLLRGDAAGSAAVDAVLQGSRVPRLATGLLIGAVLGMAGTALQSLSRNPLASPDTLAVNAGAGLLVTLTAVLGTTVPVLVGGGVAFLGGLAAAAVVVLLGGTGSSTRLVLAGTAFGLALSSVTGVLQLLFQEQTQGLFAWGSGSLVVIDLVAVRSLLPVLLVTAAVLLLCAGRLDVLALGDDAARSLGLHLGRLRLVVLLAAVLLSTTAVALAGPIGFVGLAAPVIARLLARRVPGLLPHRRLLPTAAVIGAGVVVGADVLLRAVFGSQAGVDVPTGVVTSVIGAVLLVWIARRSPATRTRTATGSVALASALRARLVLGIAALLAVGVLVAGVLIGPRALLLGDVANVLTGDAGRVVTATFRERLPRVLAAFLAGAALAAAGTVVQAVCRNPLAEPGLLGVTAGAGCGAVLAITVLPGIGLWGMTGLAALGALATSALVFLLARRGGLDSGRLVLVGIGVQAGGTALISMMVILGDPWDRTRALTWLSGSTYGRRLSEVVPVAIALLVLVPLLQRAGPSLDLLSLDDDTPRLLGLPLGRSRVLLLSGAAVLTAGAVTAIGVVAFVGLVAPHLARALVGYRSVRVLPVAVLLGGVLVTLGDLLGRTVLAPVQLPAGLVAVLVGAPYFLHLLWRTRD